jgi:hypothetical protein
MDTACACCPFSVILDEHPAVGILLAIHPAEWTGGMFLKVVLRKDNRPSCKTEKSYA